MILLAGIIVPSWLASVWSSHDCHFASTLGLLSIRRIVLACVPDMISDNIVSTSLVHCPFHLGFGCYVTWLFSNTLLVSLASLGVSCVSVPLKLCLGCFSSGIFLHFWCSMELVTWRFSCLVFGLVLLTFSLPVHI